MVDSFRSSAIISYLRTGKLTDDLLLETASPDLAIAARLWGQFVQIYKIHFVQISNLQPDAGAICYDITYTPRWVDDGSSAVLRVKLIVTEESVKFSHEVLEIIEELVAKGVNEGAQVLSITLSEHELALRDKTRVHPEP